MNTTLVISYDASVSDDFFDDLRADTADESLQLTFRSRVVGPTNALEWVLAATVIVVLTKPFLDAFLKRAADDVADLVYPKLKASVSKLACKVLIATRETWRRHTSSGPRPRIGRSSFFSIESETRQSTRIKFVFNEAADQDVYEKCISQAFTLFEAHHTDSTVDPFAGAPVETAHNTIYMVYDDGNACWQAIDLNEEVRRIAHESRERQKNTNDGR